MATATSSSSKASSPLANFDPFATHPFTNYSAPNTLNASHPTSPQPSSSHQTNLKTSFTPELPQPHTQSTRPVFVPFRQETSSPDLNELLKKKPPFSSAIKK